MYTRLILGEWGMILKRIAKGIKDQDWFVVTIEIVIVVIGIFLGMQVTDWNERQQESKALDKTLDRFVSESEGNLTFKRIFTPYSLVLRTKLQLRLLRTHLTKCSVREFL